MRNLIAFEIALSNSGDVKTIVSTHNAIADLIKKDEIFKSKTLDIEKSLEELVDEMEKAIIRLEREEK